MNPTTAAVEQLLAYFLQAIRRCEALEAERADLDKRLEDMVGHLTREQEAHTATRAELHLRTEQLQGAKQAIRDLDRARKRSSRTR